MERPELIFLGANVRRLREALTNYMDSVENAPNRNDPDHELSELRGEVFDELITTFYDDHVWDWINSKIG